MRKSTTSADLVAVEAVPVEPVEPGAVLPSPRRPDECPVTLYLANDLTTEASRRGALSNLRTAARTLTQGRVEDPMLVNWPTVTQPVMARLRALLLEQGRSPAGVNTVLAVVRGVLRQCWRLGLVSHEQFARATDVKPARGKRVDRKGRALTQGEVLALMDACCSDATPAGARDAALFALALGAGLRRAELSGLTLADWRPATAEEPDTAVLFVRGKGNKERKVYVTNGAREAVEDWLRARGKEAGGLFVPVDKGGQVHPDGGLTGQAITLAMKKRAEQAGVPPFSPHDCRRTYISGLLDHGVDISTAATLAGHASVETTRVYDRRGERAAMQAAATVHIPYSRRREAARGAG
jgi:integrase